MTNLRAGQWVEVRSKNEILSTLDKQGRLESLPFMPEMFQYCGQRFKVYKRAHKTCDPANNGIQGRRMISTVHLEGLRCDGQAHGGCEAGCLIFWKEAWLKPANGAEPLRVEPPQAHAASVTAAAKNHGCTEEDVLAGTLQPGEQANTPDVAYACQSTCLDKASLPLAWWDLRQYVEDFTSGNVRVSDMVVAFLFFIFHTLVGAGLGIRSALLWAYDLFQRARGGTPYPWRVGQIAPGMRTPSGRIHVQEGELVRVKDYQEILKTLDQEWKNRGMYFDAEMVPFCNKTFRVQKNVRKILDEKTGKMMQFKNDAVILEDVVCQAHYATCRRFCPRAIYPYWREIWLERLQENDSDSKPATPEKPANRV